MVKNNQIFFICVCSGYLFAGCSTVTTTQTNKAQEYFAQLVQEPEYTATKYSRTFFKHWIDSDKNGCNTRAEVLIAESLKPVSKDKGCKIVNGEWYSAYDDKIVLQASLVDVDHVVPLREAWDSGAWRWGDESRMAYANDLGYVDALLAVSAASNRGKSDRDPANWLPIEKYRCGYIARWIAVKWRWGLSVDLAEAQSIRAFLTSCSNEALSMPDSTKAQVVYEVH